MGRRQAQAVYIATTLRIVSDSAQRQFMIIKTREKICILYIIFFMKNFKMWKNDDFGGFFGEYDAVRARMSVFMISDAF